MSRFRSLFRASASPKAPARRAGQRLRVEGLEDRTLLSAELVADLYPGPGSSNPVGLVNANGTLYFLSDSRLCYSDGTAAGTGCTEVSRPRMRNLTYAGGNLYFISDPSPTAVSELYKTDGTLAGTARLARITGTLGTGLGIRAAVDNRIYLTGSQFPGGPSFVLTSDGTVEGTQTVWSASFVVASNLTVIGNTLFFATGGGTPGNNAIWKSEDGAPAVRIAAFPGTIQSGPSSLAKVGSLLYFSADDGTHGRELWVSDGTQIGTRLVADLVPGPAGSDPQHLIEGFGSYALFTADTPGSGREPWVCCFDGVTPTQIADINPGPLGSDPQELTADAAGFLYMSADDGTRGRELWFSDWTPEGTRLVKDVRPGPLGSDPQKLTLLYGYYLYFSADDGASGRELWASDGSEEFTVLDTDINPGPASSDPNFLVELPDAYVYFAATHPDVGRELYRASPFFAGPGGGAPADLPGRAAGADLALALLPKKGRLEQLFARAIGVLDLLPE